MIFNIGKLFVNIRGAKDGSEGRATFIVPVGETFMLMVAIHLNTHTEDTPVSITTWVYNRNNEEAAQEALLS